MDCSISLLFDSVVNGRNDPRVLGTNSAVISGNKAKKVGESIDPVDGS